jgi:hypothetical protein
MSPLFQKLNYKNNTPIVVLDAPPSFQPAMDEIALTTSVHTTLQNLSTIHFVLVFVTQQQQIDTTIQAIHPLLEGDAILWYCYPKSTSKKYTCNFNRDTGWNELGKFGFEPVRQVAIDADWSALRFRKVAYIKKFTRNRLYALSDEGKNRI